MGSFLDKPKTEKTTDYAHGNDLSYGLSAMQGWRIEMEDSHSSLIGLPKSGFEQWSFFAVFDGHAGSTVSKCSSKELINCILNADPELFNELALIYSSPSSTTKSPLVSSSTSSLSSMSPSSANKTQISQSSTNLSNNTNDSSKVNHVNSTSNSNINILNNNSNNSNEKQITNSTTNLNNKNETLNTNPELTKSTRSLKNNIDETIDASPVAGLGSSVSTVPSKYTEEIEERLKKAIRQGFLDLDENLRHMPEFERGEDKSGSTAVACLISPTHVYLINCGDSRSILVSDNQIVLNTYDHKPINPNERERIQNAGGSVMIQRVNGSLAVSRALGDFEYKCVEGRGPCEQLVSPEPEIYVRERCIEKDEFAVLACDGIWDVMSNEDLKDYVRSRLKVTNDLVKISNEVLDMCLSKGSRDNMSIIIVSFPGAPKIIQEEVEKDKTCNEKIENRIKELIESSNSRVEFSYVLQAISQEKWEEFPPGGGFYAKHTLIEEIFYRLSPRSNEDDSINSSNYLINSPL